MSKLNYDYQRTSPKIFRFFQSKRVCYYRYFMKNKSPLIKENVKVHDRVFDKYEEIHGEIFNKVEQARLAEKIKYATEQIKTDSDRKKALDYGCGTGNLTRHIIDNNIHTVAVDVSKNFLSLVNNKYSDTGLVETLQIKGEDLEGIGSEEFDFVATYSVLHHIPDYFKALEEMMRVLKRGGVIYLDHEHSEGYWNQSDDYKEFMGLVEPKKEKSIKRFFKLKNYIINLKRISNPRYEPEGDIHVWFDDHIEWKRIEKKLKDSNFEILLSENYLVYKGYYPLEVYNKFKEKCNDMHLLVARKR